MSAESISLIAGTFLSLIFSYIPGARNWFMQFSPEIKRLIMLALIILSGCIVYGLACLEWAMEWGVTLSCDQAGLLGLVEQIVIAIIANQNIYAISPHHNNINPDHLETVPGRES
jgi:uncharacterized YccA/Bax inhibitor family protein